MQIHFSMDHLPEIIFPVVTMGSFDGVHAGHRVIISRLNTLARQIGGNSVLITFHPHPRKVLYPDTAGKELRLITSLEEKCQLARGDGPRSPDCTGVYKRFCPDDSQSALWRNTCWESFTRTPLWWDLTTSSGITRKGISIPYTGSGKSMDSK